MKPSTRTTAARKKSFVERVEEANELGGCAMQTLGVPWAVAQDPDESQFMLNHSVYDLCRALALRGFDVRAKQPKAAILDRRLAKMRPQQPGRRGGKR